MEKIFEIATNISTPLALAGFLAAAFFLILRIIVKKNIFVRLSSESTRKLLIFIINRIFILAVCAMILGFIGYIIKIKTTQSLKTVRIEGTVFLNNKELNNVNVKALEIEKTAETNYYGKFIIDFLQTDTIKELTLTFSHPKAKDFKEVFNINSLKGIKVNLKPIADSTNPPTYTVYLILSGKVVNTKGVPICDASISSMDGEFHSLSNNNGYFKLESNKKPAINEMLFSISKQGYTSREEYFYLNTQELRIVLDEKQ